MTFTADRIKIAGPKIDGSYSITFEVGEYEYDKIKDIPKLNGKAIVVEVRNG